jgi:hypothetical protein
MMHRIISNKKIPLGSLKPSGLFFEKNSDKRHFLYFDNESYNTKPRYQTHASNLFILIHVYMKVNFNQ